MSEKQKLLIDTDAGVDDAIAIMMALVHPRAEVVAITTVNGNVDVDKVTKNVGLILDQYDADVPIYRGADRPLIADAVHSDFVHGSDGLGGVTTTYPSTKHTPESEHAALGLIRLAKMHAKNLTLLAVGPLTNLALALRLDPTFMNNISRLVVMGGAIEAHGNMTPAAEFNIYADPEAAAIVFDAGFHDLSLLSWETTTQYPLLWSEFDELAEINSDRAAFFRKITTQTARLIKEEYGLTGFLLPDPLAAAVALEPDLVTLAPHLPVSVEIIGEHGRGLTSVDWLKQYGKTPNAFIVQEMRDSDAYGLIRAALV